MSLVLQPGNSFTIVRQIPNHLDTNTNYVQAVIRNAYTDAVIDTVKLTDKGSQRFSKNWQVPADPSGQGFFISIVTSVYTDSGYTTKNGNYGDDENTYLVQDRILLGRVGGGSGIDAFTVRKIIKEEIAKIPPPEPVEIPEAPETVMRWNEVLRAIQGVKEAIPKPTVVPKVDLSPVLTGLEDVKQAVQAKPVTPATDLNPVLQALEMNKKVMMHLLQNIGDSLVTMAKNFLTSAKKGETPPLEAPAATPQPVPFDVTKLAS